MTILEERVNDMLINYLGRLNRAEAKVAAYKELASMTAADISEAKAVAKTLWQMVDSLTFLTGDVITSKTVTKNYHGVEVTFEETCLMER